MKHRLLLAMGLAFLLLAMPAMLGKVRLLFWNASPSVPRGLYAVAWGQPQVGDLVLVRLPTDLAVFAARRRYLARGALLIKPIAAGPGDTVCRHGVGVFVRGKRVARAHRIDGAGRPLPRWQGCRKLQPGELFLLSAHPDGLDSRYFGPVSDCWVAARAVLVGPRF